MRVHWYYLATAIGTAPLYANHIRIVIKALYGQGDALASRIGRLTGELVAREDSTSADLQRIAVEVLDDLTALEGITTDIIKWTVNTIMVGRSGYLGESRRGEGKPYTAQDALHSLRHSENLKWLLGAVCNSELVSECCQLQGHVGSLRVLDLVSQFDESSLKGCLEPNLEVLQLGRLLSNAMVEGLLFQRDVLALQEFAKHKGEHQLNDLSYEPEHLDSLQRHLQLHHSTLANVVAQLEVASADRVKLSAFVLPLNFDITSPIERPSQDYLRRALGDVIFAELQECWEGARLLKDQLDNMRNVASAPSVAELEEAQYQLQRITGQDLQSNFHGLLAKLKGLPEPGVESYEFSDGLVLCSNTLELLIATYPYFKAGYFCAPKVFIDFVDDFKTCVGKLLNASQGGEVLGLSRRAERLLGKSEGWRQHSDAASSTLLEMYRSKVSIDTLLIKVGGDFGEQGNAAHVITPQTITNAALTLGKVMEEVRTMLAMQRFIDTTPFRVAPVLIRVHEIIALVERSACASLEGSEHYAKVPQYLFKLKRALESWYFIEIGDSRLSTLDANSAKLSPTVPPSTSSMP